MSEYCVFCNLVVEKADKSRIYIPQTDVVAHEHCFEQAKRNTKEKEHGQSVSAVSSPRQ